MVHKDTALRGAGWEKASSSQGKPRLTSLMLCRWTITRAAPPASLLLSWEQFCDFQWSRWAVPGPAPHHRRSKRGVFVVTVIDPELVTFQGCYVGGAVSD